MLFKTELTEVFTMAEMDKIVKTLSTKGIDATTKTVDLMSGGLFENRRSSGTVRHECRGEIRLQDLRQTRGVGVRKERSGDNLIAKKGMK